MYPYDHRPVAIVSLLTFISVLAFFFLGLNAQALGVEPAETLVLVARPSWNDPIYGKSILVAHEMPGGQHVGFILNKPTELKLTEAFPGNAASKTVSDPIYLGGPSDLNAMFALVHSQTVPSDGALALTGNLYLAVSETAVDKAMTPAAEEQSRFFVGAVVWRRGELDAEIKQGAWYVLDATPELVLPKQTHGLWEELVRKAEMAAKAI